MSTNASTAPCSRGWGSIWGPVSLAVESIAFLSEGYVKGEIPLLGTICLPALNAEGGRYPGTLLTHLRSLGVGPYPTVRGCAVSGGADRIGP